MGSQLRHVPEASEALEVVLRCQIAASSAVRWRQSADILRRKKSGKVVWRIAMKTCCRTRLRGHRRRLFTELFVSGSGLVGTADGVARVAIIDSVQMEFESRA